LIEISSMNRFPGQSPRSHWKLRSCAVATLLPKALLN